MRESVGTIVDCGTGMHSTRPLALAKGSLSLYVAPAAAALLAVATSLTGCGAQDETSTAAEFSNDPGAPQNPSGTGADDGGTAQKPGRPGTSDAGGDAASQGAAAPTPPPPPKEPEKVAVHDLTVSEIALFQGVKVSLVKDGKAADPASRVAVVAGKSALLRVYVTPTADYARREITGELILRSGTSAPVTFTSTAAISAASQDGDLASTINFSIPDGTITATTNYSVRLLHLDAGKGTTPAQFPADAKPTALSAIDTGESLRVVLVPVRYNADGSGRVPDTSAAQLDKYRARLRAVYPTRKVEITVRAPYDYSGSIATGGSGIATLLQTITKLRKSDNAPADVYYYGAFMAADTFRNYCSGGCTTGICHLVTSADDTLNRACTGVGFTGEDSAGTMAHELGHAHGLPHAPCGGVSGSDTKYPYPQARIGSWGWDERSSKLVDPSQSKDFMSYCSPAWISDYNYEKLATRMAAVNTTRDVVRGAPVTYRFAQLNGEGQLRWGDTMTLDEPLVGEPHTVTYEAESGARQTVSGYFWSFDEIPGGTLLVPEPPQGVHTVTIAGFARTIVTQVPRF